MSTTERPPVTVDYRARNDERGIPRCGKCRRVLPGLDAWRCPYVACRVWLRTAGEAEAARKARRQRPSLEAELGS